MPLVQDRLLIDGHKLHLHPTRVAQWLAAGDDWEQQKKVYPIYIEISPVGACNHRCTFCAVDYIGYKQVYLDKDVLLRTLTDMARAGVRSIMFAGEGEPLLHKDLGKVIVHAKSVGLDVAITTNGVALTEKFAAEALGAVTWLKASINAGTAATYAKVHRTKEVDFERVFTNLARAVQLRKEKGWKTTLGAQTVILPENFHEVFDLCERARAIGLDYVVLKPYSQHLKSDSTRERGYERTDFIDEAKLAKTLQAFTSDKFKVIYRSQTVEHMLEKTRYYQTCHSTPFFWAYIMASGDVYGCSAYLLDERFKYGNINASTFSEIWEGERRRQSADFVRHHLDIHECRKNCRMDHVNRYLWDLMHPLEHANFI